MKSENCNYEQAFLKLRQTFYYKVMNDILLYTSYKLKLKKLKLQTQHFKWKFKKILQSCEWHFTLYKLQTENLNYEQNFLKLRQTFCYSVVNNILFCTSYKMKSKNLSYKHNILKTKLNFLLQSSNWHFTLYKLQTEKLKT